MANDTGAGLRGMTSSEVHALQQHAQAIQSQLNGLVAQVAKIEAVCSATAQGIDRAQDERKHLWVEIRGYGEKLITVSNRLEAIVAAFAKLEATVSAHDDNFMRAEGASKFAVAITKVLWALGGAVVAGAGALITYIAQSGGNPPGR